MENKIISIFEVIIGVFLFVVLTIVFGSVINLSPDIKMAYADGFTSTGILLSVIPLILLAAAVVSIYEYIFKK
jgi:hypothetical protein